MGQYSKFIGALVGGGIGGYVSTLVVYVLTVNLHWFDPTNQAMTNAVQGIITVLAGALGTFVAPSNTPTPTKP